MAPPPTRQSDRLSVIDWFPSSLAVVDCRSGHPSSRAGDAEPGSVVEVSAGCPIDFPDSVSRFDSQPSFPPATLDAPGTPERIPRKNEKSCTIYTSFALRTVNRHFSRCHRQTSGTPFGGFVSEDDPKQSGSRNSRGRAHLRWVLEVEKERPILTAGSRFRNRNGLEAGIF
jgi:hypothetical protein